MEISYSQRITVDPNICHGKPCIRGLRYPVEFILELLNSGMSIEEILTDYNDLEREDILACIEMEEDEEDIREAHIALAEAKALGTTSLSDFRKELSS